MSMASPIPRIISRLGQPCCHWSVATNLLPTDHLSDHVGRSRHGPVDCSQFLEQQLLLIIISLFIQHHPRSTACNPVATADERLKQRLREVSLCARAGGSTAVSPHAFFRTQSSNSLLHLSISTSISSITFHQHNRLANPA